MRTRSTIGLVVASALTLVASLGLPGLRQRAMMGSAYVAKEVCSCVHVGLRSFEECVADMPAFLDAVEAEALEDGVRGFVPVLASRTARHTPGFGCTLEPPR